jgi:hypothetical protein
MTIVTAMREAFDRALLKSNAKLVFNAGSGINRKARETNASVSFRTYNSLKHAGILS